MPQPGNFGLHIVLQGFHLSFPLLVFGLFLYSKCIVPNLEGTHLSFNFVCVCGDRSYHCFEILHHHCFQSPHYLHLLRRHLPRDHCLICITCVTTLFVYATVVWKAIPIFGAQLQLGICMLSPEPKFSFGKFLHKLP